jgi:hypothetical protein
MRWTVLYFLLGVYVLIGSYGVGSAAQLVVLSSTDKTIPTGAIIEDSSLAIAPGATVTVIDQAGRMHNLTGPYKGVPGAGKSENVGELHLATALRRLIADDATSTKTLGVIRKGASDDGGNPNNVSADDASIHCIILGETPILARVDSSREERVRLKQRGGDAVRFIWAKGKSTMAWPADLSPVDGGTYLLRRAGKSLPVRIDIKVSDDRNSSPDFIAAWMAASGCKRQAEAALTALDGG